MANFRIFDHEKFFSRPNCKCLRELVELNQNDLHVFRFYEHEGITFNATHCLSTEAEGCWRRVYTTDSDWGREHVAETGCVTQLELHPRGRRSFHGRKLRKPEPFCPNDAQVKATTYKLSNVSTLFRHTSSVASVNDLTPDRGDLCWE